MPTTPMLLILLAVVGEDAPAPPEVQEIVERVVRPNEDVNTMMINTTTETEEGEGDDIKVDHVPILLGMMIEGVVMAEAEAGEDIAAAATETIEIITTIAHIIHIVDQTIIIMVHPPKVEPRHTPRNDTRNNQCYVNFYGRRNWKRSRRRNLDWIISSRQW